MRYAELFEARLLPQTEFVDELDELLDIVNQEYSDYLKAHDDKDDPELLALFLNDESEESDLNIEWQVAPEGRDAVDWYIHSAMVYTNGDIVVWLHPESIVGYWGPKSFKDAVIKTIQHELIHVAQKERMGTEKYTTIPSGYQKGLKVYKKTGKEQDLKRLYFRDPHELMAHGHDVAQEIIKLSQDKNLDSLDILKNIEKYKDDLPTYHKHRTVFPTNAKPLQRLIKYAYEYIQNYIDK